MASRAGGRHRDTGGWGPPDRPSLLLFDYLESGSFGHLGRATSRAGSRRRGSRQVWRLRDGVRRASADGRVLVSVVLAGIVAAVLVGIYVPLRSTWASPGQRPPAPSAAPQVPAPSAASPVPATPMPKPAKTVRPRPARRTAPPPRQAAMMPAPSTAPATRPAARASHAVAAPKPAIIVRFIINSQGIAGFEGQVQVINNTAQPIAGWQIVVALPGDRVVTVTNASGFVSNGILVLQPAFGAPPIPARGGVLNVFFIAVGPQTTPGACAFNQIPCT